MTYKPAPFAKAMTAIAAVLAFSSTPVLAQETGAPPEPVADTVVETPATADPLAPEAADTTATAPTEATPAAPKPKVESKTATSRTKAVSSKATTSSTVRRASAAAPAAAPAARAAAPVAEPAPPPAEPLPPIAAEPAAPAPVAEPALTADTNATVLDDNMLPIAGAAALGLLALGGTGLAVRRRRRRREDEEFEARQQALAALEAEPSPAERPVEAGPAFSRPMPVMPVHDPVPGTRVEQEPAMAAPSAMPDRGNWESRSDADFMFRRAAKDDKQPADQH